MKDIRTILAAAGLFFATGAMGTAQADDGQNSATLYTSALRASRLSCNAVNVGRKTLTITISIIDGTEDKPTMVVPAVTTKTDPGLEISNDYGNDTFTSPPAEGYCVFQISGGDRGDVRAALIGSTVAKRTTADGTTFPYYVTRVLEAY